MAGYRVNQIIITTSWSSVEKYTNCIRLWKTMHSRKHVTWISTSEHRLCNCTFSRGRRLASVQCLCCREGNNRYHRLLLLHFVSRQTRTCHLSLSLLHVLLLAAEMKVKTRLDGFPLLLDKRYTETNSGNILILRKVKCRAHGCTGIRIICVLSTPYWVSSNDFGQQTWAISGVVHCVL